MEQKRWDVLDARAALARFIARRCPGQTRFGIALHIERLLTRKTCPACWGPTGFGMQAQHLGDIVAHRIGCEAAAATTRYRVRHRADRTLAVLLRAARE